MGIAIPQVIAEDRASGAQVIDGSIVFDRSKLKHLKKTISTTGDQRTFTVSFWFKKQLVGNLYQYFFTTEYTGTGNYFEITSNSDQFHVYGGNGLINVKITRKLRDTDGWMHAVVAIDSTIATPATDRVKIYLNGERQEDYASGGSVFPPQNHLFTLEGSRNWHIGAAEFNSTMQGYYDGHMSNFYFADGQALGPEEFGFTDPLTNTWRPKKYEGSLAKYTVPTGYTYWNGMNQNWNSGGTTSSGNDYINSALPSNTKVYWEVTVNDPAIYRQVGISENAAGTGTGYTDNLFGFYMNNVSLGPLILTQNASGTSRNGSVSHGQRASVWNDGDTVMWAWDPINDGIYFGLNGTWYGGGDPANGINPAIVGEDLSAASFYFKQGRTDGDNTQTHTNITSSNATYFGDISEVTIGTNSFYLPMDGNSPIGEDKSGNSNINDGTIWSNDVTTSNAYSANRDPGKGFDGNSSLVGQSDTYVQSDNSSGTVTWTPNGYTIDTADEILVKGISSLDRLSVVGSLGSQSNIAPATVNGITNVYTIPTNLGTLTSLTVTGNSSLAGWSGITVGGILLVNGLKGNSWTPVNFGGSSAIDKATGALPILNTVSGGRVATLGVGTDAFASNLVLALPLVDTTTDASGIINSGTTSKTITAYNNAAPASDGQGVFYGVSLYLDGTDDYVETSNSDDFVVGTGDFTIEAWYNVAETQGTNSRLFAQNVNDDNNWDCYLGGSHGTSDIMMHGGTVDLKMSFPTANAWHHFCIARKDGTLYSFMNGVLRHTQTYTNSVGANNHGFRVGVIGGSGGSTAYGLQGYVQDFRFYKGVAKYTSDFIPASTNPDILPDTPSGVSGSSKLTKITDGSVNFDGNATETSTGLTVTTNIDWSSNFTVEGFYYPNELGGGRTLFDCWSGNTDGTGFYVWTNANGSIDLVKNSNTYYSSGWCGSGSISSNKWSHFAIVRSSNTLYMYIDGVNKSGSGYSISDSWSSSRGCILGSGSGNSSMQSVNGFMNNVRISQTAIYTSNFTPPTTSLSSLGADTKVLGLKSQQSVTSTEVGTITDVGGTAATNFNPFTTDINTVRGQETSYATLNPLATQKSGTLTLSNGNLTATIGATRTSAYASLPFVGKMYYEVTFATRAYVFGMAPSEDFNTTANTAPHRFIGESPGSYGASDDGNAWNNLVNTSIESFAVGDCMGWAYDSDSGKYSIIKNGINLGTFTADTSRTYYPAITLITSGSIYELNFGQKPFKFPPPDGYGPMNAANVRPETVIARPDQYVGVTTYHGDNNVRTEKVGFKPDLVWIKDYSSNSHFHVLCDSVRGGANILSSSNDLKQFNNTGYVQGFESDGFRLGADTHVNGDPGTPYAYVAWAWKAGGEVGVGRSFMIDGVGFSTAGDAGFSPQAIPTSGSLNAVEIEPFKASISTETGFSIVHYKGSDNDNDGILHGLKQKPDFVIVKNMNRIQTVGNENYTEWRVWHSGFGDNRNLKLGNYGTAAKNYWADGNIYGHTSPDTSMRMVGSTTKFGVNYLSDDYIMYSWHNVPGLQKFGSFAGNGDADGPFIELGFRPAIVWVKNYTAVGYNWVVQDSERQKYNPVSDYLLLDQINQTATGLGVDFLNNGFKIRNANGNMNRNAQSDLYIYCAWAESPSVNLYGGQSNAR